MSKGDLAVGRLNAVPNSPLSMWSRWIDGCHAETTWEQGHDVDCLDITLPFMADYSKGMRADVQIRDPAGSGRIAHLKGNVLTVAPGSVTVRCPLVLLEILPAEPPGSIVRGI